MALTFTFFNDDAFFNQGSHIYVGDLKEEGIQSMAYRIKMKRGEFWLYDGAPKECGRKELLHGNFDGGLGFYSSSGIIRGYNSVADFGTYGFFTSKFKFVDGHTGRTYKWKADAWQSGWELKDPEKQVIATFDRYKFKLTKQGCLTIYLPNIPEHLLALILVTQKLVHDGVKRRERQQNAQMNKQIHGH